MVVGKRKGKGERLFREGRGGGGGGGARKRKGQK